MNRSAKLMLSIAALAAMSCAASASWAQCTTCATPTTAYYQPAMQTVAYQPTITYQPYTGWYPGRLLDRMRLRRWSRRNGATTTTAAPYVAAYAPLQRNVVQTSYYQPVSTVDSCTGCTQTSYRPVVAQSYAPTTSYRPVIMRPVVAMRPVVSMSPVVQSSCATVDSGCSSCVGQATYSQASPVDSSCSTCSGGYSYSSPEAYSSPSSSAAPSGGNGGYYGPTTPQPTLDGMTPTPAESRYPSEPTNGTENGGSNNEAAPAEADDATTGLGAPLLLKPSSDRLTRRPSVNVHHAVYRPAVHRSTVNSRSAAEVRAANETRRPTPKNIDGWHSAP